MINSQLAQSFEGMQTVTRSLISVQVECVPSGVMEALASSLLSEMERLAPSRGLKELDDLTSEDILNYLKTLVWMRVNYVNRVRLKNGENWDVLYHQLAVPSLMYQILICLGKVRDNEFNIEFIPTTTLSESEILSAAEMSVISDLMVRLHQNGLNCVFGMPKEREGELGFMALQHVSNTVVGYRKDHPVYGFLASFFCQESLNEITGQMMRIVYGYEADYKFRVAALV